MSTEELKVGGVKTPPANDILLQAACERQRKWWIEKLPDLSDVQITTIMTTLTQATNMITALDMADGLRNEIAYRSRLGTDMRMVLEMLSCPADATESNG